MNSIRAKGFTLVELMTVIAVIAILTAMAFPSFLSSLRSNRVSTATNEVMASLALARSEAIRSARGGGVCTSADGNSCGGSWNDGWLVWTDNNGNGALDEGEPVIRYVQAKQKMTVAGSAAILAFDARGRSEAGIATIDLHPEDVATPARCIHLSATGQTRIEKEAC